MGRQKFEAMCQTRLRLIQQSNRNPLEHGWEPSVWSLADALLDFNWYAHGSPSWEKKRDKNRAIREKLGFKYPVDVLLIQGGNRIGKTEYAAKRVMQLLLADRERKAWVFHEKEDMSNDSHQPLLYKFMPGELKTEKGIKTSSTYVAYKDKTGFTGNSFILHNRSKCIFKFYAQQQDATIQGPACDVAWPDELIPLGWLRDLMFRAASTGGKVVSTFTPKNGFNATVAWFYEGAETVLESTAFLLPTDGGPPDVARALGFHSEEDFELAYSIVPKSEPEVPFGPNSHPENFDAWMEGKPRQPAIPEGRGFETMPRVMRCTPIFWNGEWRHNRAVLFFHSCDGPYGKPENVMRAAATMNTTEIKWRVYGFATRMATARFTKFSDHHIIDPEKIPSEGTNYFFYDPASDRNPFLSWFRVCGNDCFLYREWPGNYDVPGQGVPGPWAEPCDKKLDGQRGSGQESFGWGYRRIKQEIARLEGWKEYNETGVGIADWMQSAEDQEFIYERFMDSRAASAPKIENDRKTTPLEIHEEDLNMTFIPTPADDIDSGVQVVNDMLDWDPGDDAKFTGMRLFISADCLNTIYALRTWTGRDGNKGACKDPIDNLRYFALSNLTDASNQDLSALSQDYG